MNSNRKNKKTNSRTAKKRAEHRTSWMFAARHDAGDSRSTEINNEVICKKIVPTAHNGLQNIHKFQRTSTQGRGDNSTRNVSSTNSMNWESSCARWKPQQATCHKEHVRRHRQCSTYRATWPIEVLSKYTRPQPQNLELSILSIGTALLHEDNRAPPDRAPPAPQHPEGPPYFLEDTATLST